jgi:acyl carrier protein
MSGAGLSRGYLNQPQLNEDRFLPHPFRDDPAERLYRTGDLGRFLPDGNIEFLGRIDQQVKIRGFRVEPAEVETVLTQFPGVRRAVVLAEPDSDGNTQLAAYVESDQIPGTPELRSYLSSRLPEYLVPARFVAVRAIPLTSNGKVDTRSLAALGNTDSSQAHALAAPGNPDEEKLAAIWREVLHRDRVGVHDNFFDLGGHSLLAMQIISRVRSRFGVQLPVQTFLATPTVADLAAKIRQCPQIETEEEEIARILQELEGLSDEEAERLLEQHPPA